jgi:IPT/TIG domain
MEHRARIRTRLRRAGLSAALAALLVPAVAGTADAAHSTHHKAKHVTHHKAKHKAKKKHKAKLPVITSVRPMHAAVGDTLTIKGRNFRRGVNKNTVIFMRTGGRPIFVKAGKATAKKLLVTLPKGLAGGLQVKSGVPVTTRFRLRVLAAKFGKSFTSRKHSPLIDPERTPVTHPTPSPSAPDADCDGDRTTNRFDADDDNDLLVDTVEIALKLDPCKADTDGDGVSDGFEYRSAVDLNDDEYQNKATVPHNDILPYPGKRPYPNPLDPTDAHTDYDGDSLQLSEEYTLWRYTLAHEGAPYSLERLTYSDGTQYSLFSRDANGRRHPAQLASTYPKHAQFVQWATANGYRDVYLYVRPTYAWNDPSQSITGQVFSIFDNNLDGSDDSSSYDLDRNTYISDDERDEDADGLSNFDETHGRMYDAKWWSTCYQQETPYPITYAGTDVANPDSDGDGILDGADDQDHDDIPNIMELSRAIASVSLPGRPDGWFDGKKQCTPPDPPAGSTPPLHQHSADYGQVNPFNPCLPAPWSRTCNRHPELQNEAAPFDLSPDWYALN